MRRTPARSAARGAHSTQAARTVDHADLQIAREAAQREVAGVQDAGEPAHLGLEVGPGAGIQRLRGAGGGGRRLLNSRGHARVRRSRRHSRVRYFAVVFNPLFSLA